MTEPMNEAEPVVEPRRTEQRMDFDQYNVDRMCKDTGGAFRATAIIQKRLRDLVKYGDDFNRADNKTLIFSVMDEINAGQLGFTLAQDVEAEEHQQ